MTIRKAPRKGAFQALDVSVIEIVLIEAYGIFMHRLLNSQKLHHGLEITENLDSL